MSPLTEAIAVVTRVSTGTRVSDYMMLVKLRLTSMVLVTVAVGFLLGSAGAIDGWGFLSAIVGIALVSGGAGALNQWMEREPDGRMLRTQNRPLPAGRLAPGEVLALGLVSCVAGTVMLVVVANLLTAALGLATALIYLLAYTPLKRLTPLNTFVGAISGALPPMIGWAAAAGELTAGAWALFAILFVWQLPHFFAIAWIYREEYAAAGMKMLSVGDTGGRVTRRVILLFCLVMIPVSLLPILAGVASPSYLFAAVPLGLLFLLFGILLARHESRDAARHLFLASVIYLPCLLAAVMVDWMIVG